MDTVSDKANRVVVPASTEAAVDHGGVIELVGKDAIAFVQAQCMNDVAVLSDGAWQWNGWLSPKGRLIALFALIRLGPERLWLWLPDHPAEALLERLGRFVLRAKVTLRGKPELHAVARFEPPAAIPESRCRIAGSSPETGLVLDFGADGGPRWLILRERAAEADPRGEHAWRLADLRHGLPRLGGDASEAWTPHMLSLQRLSAFSVRKGCYPGQEIVSRTHFLGQAKRALTRLRSDSPLVIGQTLYQAEQALGTIVSASSVPGGGHEALAVLPVETEGPLHAHADSRGMVERLPLLNGLERSGRAPAESQEARERVPRNDDRG